MDNKSSSAGSFLFGVLVGGAVGAVVALLFAPKSGKELRRDLAETGEDFLDKAGDMISRGGEQVDDAINEGRQRAQRIVSSARQQAESILNNAESVLNEARQRAQSIKDRVESFRSESDG
jgi:gas vesicle protein